MARLFVVLTRDISTTCWLQLLGRHCPVLCRSLGKPVSQATYIASLDSRLVRTFFDDLLLRYDLACFELIHKFSYRMALHKICDKVEFLFMSRHLAVFHARYREDTDSHEDVLYGSEHMSGS